MINNLNSQYHQWVASNGWVLDFPVKYSSVIPFWANTYEKAEKNKQAH